LLTPGQVSRLPFVSHGQMIASEIVPSQMGKTTK